MPEDDSHDLVIETGVDTLLNYMSDHEEAPISTIAADIGVSQDRVKKWADALEERDLMEKDYTFSNGLVLHLTDQNQRELKMRKDILEEDLEELKEDTEEKMERKQNELTEAKTQLRKVYREVDRQKRIEQDLESQIDELEQREDELRKRLRSEKEVDDKDLEMLHEIDEVLSDVREEENKSDFSQQAVKLRKHIKAMEKLEQYFDMQPEEGEEKEEGDNKPPSPGELASAVAGRSPERFQDSDPPISKKRMMLKKRLNLIKSRKERR